MFRFLVTGGAGFIGSHIVQSFLSKGHYVRILDNFSAGRMDNIRFLKESAKSKYSVIRGDIRNPKTCHAACQSMDFVIHQAACKSVPKSISQPHLFNEVNIQGTVNLLDASVRHKIKRFVFASSSSVYGNSKSFPQIESHLPDPISPYGITKLAGERYCSAYTHLHGLETVCLRYFNVFGPRQDFKDIYSAVIVKFIDHVLQRKSPPVYGTGKQSRDFTYVDNVVEANFIAATKKGVKHEIFNVAMGKSISILDLVRSLNKLTGQNLKPKFLPYRAGDILLSLSSSDKIRKKLGFRPHVSFEEGLRLTLESFR